MRIVLIVVLIALPSYPMSGVAAETPFEFSGPAEEQRYRELLAELRCLVCQNQSLADSNADLAQDLREEVYRLMKQGGSDKEVIAFLVARYGDFVLYRPPVKPITYLLWFGPALLLMLGIVVMVRFVRRRPAQTARALTEKERQQMAHLLGHNATNTTQDDGS
ncbi:MAG: cytochrome c-type biogenesis protein [Acidiferrobacterales bacterium]